MVQPTPLSLDGGAGAPASSSPAFSGEPDEAVFAGRRKVRGRKLAAKADAEVESISRRPS